MAKLITLKTLFPAYLILSLLAGLGQGDIMDNPMNSKYQAAAKGPPVVINTNPQACANDVTPSLGTITVTFDQTMMDKSWSWTGGGETYPKTTGQPSYDQKRTTCSLPVKLEPGKVYWVGINSPSHQNFKSADGVPAKRYVILFATMDQNGKPTVIPEDMLAKAKEINSQNK
jgi:hypothetical protein